MTVAAIILFGSLARSDQSVGSDTDVLVVNAEDEIRQFSVGHLSMFLYPWLRLKRDAQEGDLFACHIVHEAKEIFDPDGYLLKLKREFHFKPHYQTEIAQAIDFGWFLARFGGELNPALQVKRTLWCVRTILIARSAERRDPVFAPRLLAERTRSEAARELLLRRHDRPHSSALLNSLRLFLEDETTPAPFYEQAERAAFIQRFGETSNKVALQTLQQEERGQATYL